MINKLIGLFTKSKGLKSISQDMGTIRRYTSKSKLKNISYGDVNRNYLQTKPFTINIKKQLDNQKKFSTDLKSKNFRKNTKIKEYTKRFI